MLEGYEGQIRTYHLNEIAKIVGIAKIAIFCIVAVPNVCDDPIGNSGNLPNPRQTA
jgi:hypothetical protein